ncbi:RNA polymerase sigma factor SigC [Merismopedia glauca]|uniref:RNA polymerase sigma factor n=1 Tax=Merismopedia glauca CCAP 1448/3 TaxID=1296344 RepID=A0A2T1C6V5_9CYAN|nr:RNA polymerase sigma factor SigC [Merismopedia glauca]PSB04000.1 RNA polymerase sigma factor, RpoD/SigA family [Merismopedia glauca CCAP 1448/3]
MQVTTFELEISSKKQSVPKEVDLFAPESGFDLETVENSGLNPTVNPQNKDLVRLYLQEIGRVNLLTQSQEITEAKKVQRYMRLLDLLHEVGQAEDLPGQAKEPILQQYLALVEIRDRLSSQLGHRPALERLAKEAQISVADLRTAMLSGKQRWAEIANLSVSEFDTIQSQALKAKSHMIEANLRLVVSVAKKYQNRGLELLDLIQEGTIGLERAVDKFDPTKGYRFSTYAYWWIRQGITRAIATQSRTIRLPVHITEKLNKIKKAQRQFAQEKGYTPTIEDIAGRLEMSPPQIREVLMRVPRSVSLDTKVGKEKDTELGDLLEAEDNATPEILLMREALQRELFNLLAELTGRERDVIRLRFGLEGINPHSLAEIGRVLDLSRERVRQIESKALQKLRQPKRRSRVRDYLEAFG